MAYLGIQTQISRNNRNTFILLITFPLLVLAMVYAFIFITTSEKQQVGTIFIQTVPFVLLGVGVWFIIAYFANTKIIELASGAQPLSRRDNMRVYNLVENLCISQGMPMPKIYILEDSSLNAFASGINEKTYTVTLSRGIIDKLDDAELEGVIAHELTHILNKDVRLLIVSIVFVGIFAFLAQIAFRRIFYSSFGGRNKNNNAIVMIAVVVITAIAYFISMLIRFSISRSREYMADAGAAEMTRNPLALASALKKISQDSNIESIKNESIAQLFIDHPVKKKNSFSLDSLFATHPPIEKRIKVLEDF
jgi:heat shock protein HtpX